MTDLTTIEQIIKKVRQIAELVNLKSVYLFGSYSKGTNNVNSDVDLLIIVPDKENEKKISIDFQKRISNKDIAYDVLVCSQKRLQQKLTYNGFVQNIIKNGKLIYDRR